MAKEQAQETLQPTTTPAIEGELCTVDEAVDVAGVKSIEPVPQVEWITRSALAREIGCNPSTVNKLADTYAADNPELIRSEAVTKYKSVIQLAPELAQVIRDELAPQLLIEEAPDDWLTLQAAAQEIGIAPQTLRSKLREYLRQQPASVQQFKHKKTGHVHEFYDPEVIKDIGKEFTGMARGDEVWVTATTLRKILGVNVTTVRKCLEEYREDYPEYFCERLDARNLLNEHYNVQLLDLIRNDIPPPEYLTLNELYKELSVSHDSRVFKKLIDDCIRENPELAKEYKVGKGKIYYHPSVVEKLNNEIELARPPEGWIVASATSLSRSSGVPIHRVEKMLGRLKAEHPELIRICAPEKGPRKKFIAPQLESTLNQELNRLIEDSAVNEKLVISSAETSELRDNLASFVNELGEQSSETSQKFTDLINLFGSERTIDILYQFHPEYKKLPLPYVKSTLADYLGEFLRVRREFDIEKLSLAGDYLSEPNMRAGLAEVIKHEALRFYNELKKTFPGADDRQIIEGYLQYLNQETGKLNNEDLDDVLSDVEIYYNSLFDDIHKPENMLDQVSENRLFPDINQRINILKLAEQNKLLIADEMGLGKSASAILAKETLGVKQALIVAPKNVVKVWEKYLSDEVSDEGEPIGYFKPGQAPKVLIIKDLRKLKSKDASEYDYLILSQECLNKPYMKYLRNIDYGMLIVDEAHKLKNITRGKRAEYLVELAERINGHEDKYLTLLTGTPVPNKVGDIAMSLKLLYPNKFEDIPNNRLVAQILEGDVLDLRSLLLPKMEMKALAESVPMPKLIEVEHPIKLSKQEQAAYEILLEEDELTATQKLQILRQFILNPEVFDATPDMQSSKVQAVAEALQQTYAEKDKVVMFVNGYINGVIRGEQNIRNNLNLPADVTLRIIDGSTSAEDRLAIQKELNEGEGKMLLAVSGQTADVGVDFTGADELYFYNEPWTEFDRRQQLARVYRPGLKKDLIARTFYAEGTIEEGIHKYIEVKYRAVEKLLKGIPISEIERRLLKKSEEQPDKSIDVNPALAEYYFSSWDRMLKIYSYVKELGEEDFKKFLTNYGREYADCYVDLGSRSYQANASRLSGTVIDNLAKARKQTSDTIKIIDVASGPEMLKRHIDEGYADSVISVDINPHHFEQVDDKRRVGSFLDLPVEDKSADYANLSLALHYTKFVPSKGTVERIKVFQELNRVLKVDGVAVINLMHTLDLKDSKTFEEAIYKLGFKLNTGYSGEVSSANNFRSHLLVLQKFQDCSQDTASVVQDLGRLTSGFKFVKSDAIKLRDSRKIVTTFIMSGKRKLQAKLNQADQAVLEEEQGALKTMRDLKKQFGGIRAIPKDKVIHHGLSRIFNGKKYVLFKRLISGPGAVVGR